MTGFRLLFCALTITAAPAWANDSVAGMALGGLELRQTDAIAMLSEDLYISPDLVRVRYVFRNETDEAVGTLVAFPLPELGQLTDMNYVSLPDPGSDNYVRFETFVDSQPVALQVEHRAMLDGHDRASDLAALGVPPVPFDYWSAQEMLNALPAETLAALRAGGFLDDEGLPRWTLRSTFYREQVFEPQTEVVVEHRYVPVAAGSVESVFPAPADPSDFYTEWWRDYHKEASARYCVSDNDEAAMRAQLSGETGLRGYSTFMSHEVGYILTTGANWAGPIRDFHLTVEAPGRWNWAFLCLEGIERVSPSRLVFHAQDFTPPHELSAYFSIAVGEAVEAQP